MKSLYFHKIYVAKILTQLDLYILYNPQYLHVFKMIWKHARVRKF